MTGYVVRKAKELGVPVPVTESVYKDGEGRGVRRQGEARGSLGRRTGLVRHKKRDPASCLPFSFGDG